MSICSLRIRAFFLTAATLASWVVALAPVAALLAGR
jgi:hypothetical protein